MMRKWAFCACALGVLVLHAAGVRIVRTSGNPQVRSVSVSHKNSSSLGPSAAKGGSTYAPVTPTHSNYTHAASTALPPGGAAATPVPPATPPPAGSRSGSGRSRYVRNCHRLGVWIRVRVPQRKD